MLIFPLALVTGARKPRLDRNALLLTLKKARLFVAYAREYLPMGRPEMGDTFPRQADAEVLLAEIDVHLREHGR